jgi:hypothetical protein
MQTVHQSLNWRLAAAIYFFNVGTFQANLVTPNNNSTTIINAAV